MIRGILVLSAVAVLSSGGAGASEKESRSRPHSAATGTMLAQMGDVDIYYDQRGRRIIVDAYTGEVLSIERPRRAERQILREDPRRDRYYLDDPDDAARLRRDRNRDRVIGRIDEYGVLHEILPEEPVEAFPPPPGTFGEEPWQEEPDWRGEPGWEEEPEVVTRAPLGPPSAEQPVSPTFDGTIQPPAGLGAREEVAALQVLLDRRGASPGVIDGQFGSNVDKAIVSYREITGENLKSTDTEGIRKALAASGGDPFVEYTITAQDAAGPFVAAIPSDYGEKAKLERLGYTSVVEALAERFHMDEAYLRALNPDANLGRREPSFASPMSAGRRPRRSPASSRTSGASRCAPMTRTAT